MRELINLKLFSVNDTSKIFSYAEFIFANEPQFNHFSWGDFGPKMSNCAIYY